jgi:hypothetical protein
MTTESGFSVTYTLAKYLPMTVPVTVTRVPGDFTTPAHTTVDPSPVVAELQPATPPRRVRRGAAKRAAARAPAAGTAFPPPR